MQTSVGSIGMGTSHAIGLETARLPRDAALAVAPEGAFAMASALGGSYEMPRDALASVAHGS